MPTAWGGADPVQANTPVDPAELGTVYLANVDITITHIRVWNSTSPVSVVNRHGRIWTTGGSQIGIATLADDLPSGWTTYALDIPVERLAGTAFVVSYTVGGNYGIIQHGIDNAVNSADNAVTALAPGNTPHGNGCYNSTQTLYPVSTFQNSFYGVDVVYELGVGGNTPPIINSLTASAVSALVTATIAAVDDQTLVGAIYRFDWGDGSTVTNTASNSAQHTYSVSGIYAILGSITDAGGLSDYAATAVTVNVPETGTGLNAGALMTSLVDDALRTGYFEAVNGHEPLSAPGAGITAAVWVQDIRPVPSASGLATVSILLTFNIRIYSNAQQEPQDAIDPAIITAAAGLVSNYASGFTLAGTARNVDIFGEAGTSLSAVAGYTEQNDVIYRVMTVILPIIISDEWVESP